MKPKSDPSTKPYFRCLSCPRFRRLCGGIPTRDMDFKNWCEYMRDVRDTFHLKNADIARDADSSLSTVERIMSISCETDILRATARRYELAIIGNAGTHSCALDNDPTFTEQLIAQLRDELETVKKDKARLEKIIDKFIG